MVRIFKHYVPHAVLLLGLMDFVLLVCSAEAAWIIRARQIGMDVDAMSNRAMPLVSFATALQAAVRAVGV